MACALPCYWWPMLPTLRCLLKRIGQLQYPKLILMPPNNLQADWQTFGREAAGHRDGRQPCHRNEVTRAHPINVRLHRHTIDLSNVTLLHVEGRYLVDRTNHELICLHELPYAVIECRALA